MVIASVLRAASGWRDADPPGRLRALGPVERSLLQYHDDLGGSGNTARVVQLDGPLTTSLLRDALGVLQARHPFLHAGVVRTPAPVFVDRPEAVVPLTTRARTASDDWIAAVEDALAEQFDVERGPFLRVVWLDGSARQLPDVLVFVTCHVVTDGFSSSAMVAEFFEILAEIDRGVTPSGLARPIPPCTSDLLPDAVTGLAGAWQVLQLVVRHAVSTATTWPAALPSHAAAPSERRTRLLPRALPLEVTERLAAEAKRRGATLHAALLAAKLIAAARLIEARGTTSGPMTLTAVTTTNLRPRLRPGLETEVAARVGGLRGASTVHGHSEFWALARQVREDVRQGVASNDDILATPLAPLFSYLQANIPGLTAATVQLANLGRTPVRERYGRFTIGSVHAALNISGFGPSFLSHITTTATGTYWNVLYCEPLLSHEDAQEFAASALQLIGEMATAE